MLETPTMAVDPNGGKRRAVTIPAEAVIKVISIPRSGEPMIEVLGKGTSC